MIAKFQLTDKQQQEIIEKAVADSPLPPEQARAGLQDMIKLMQAGLMPGRSCWLFPLETEPQGRPEFSNIHGAWICNPVDIPVIQEMMKQLGIEILPPTRQGLRALGREYRKKNAALDKLLARQK